MGEMPRQRQRKKSIETEESRSILWGGGYRRRRGGSERGKRGDEIMRQKGKKPWRDGGGGERRRDAGAEVKSRVDGDKDRSKREEAGLSGGERSHSPRAEHSKTHALLPPPIAAAVIAPPLSSRNFLLRHLSAKIPPRVLSTSLFSH